MCDARIRPFPNDTEVACELDVPHEEHLGHLRDYAYQGSVTAIRWLEGDRRSFHGEWPGFCSGSCLLPRGHDGRHV